MSAEPPAPGTPRTAQKEEETQTWTAAPPAWPWPKEKEFSKEIRAQKIDLFKSRNSNEEVLSVMRCIEGWGGAGSSLSCREEKGK